MEFVQLVDENDVEVGVMEKILAHRDARLHRAISVFIFNAKGELLLQQRAASKYHSPLLWTNTCCSHPRPEESAAGAANRRLKEEMGMNSSLHYQFGFVYRAELDNQMTEHEYDHVFFGLSDDTPQINTDEVADWQYRSLDQVEAMLQQSPELFTEWFKLIFDRVKELRK
jgi:isopentenyl-diphosphate Delta-isomerase